MAPRLITRSKQVKFIDFTEEIKKSFAIKESPKKPRTKLESWQILALEKAYEDDSHPSQKAKTRLSSALGLQIKSIQIWFQNKRAKEKSRREQDETDSESLSYSADEASSNRSSASITCTSKNYESYSVNSSYTLLPEVSRSSISMDSSDVSKISMTYSSSGICMKGMAYDECYGSTSSIFDEGNTTICSEYDSFLSSFSSPIVCMPSYDRKDSAFIQEKPENTLCLGLGLGHSSAEKRSFFVNSDPLFTSPDQYKCQLIDGNIIYKKENDQMSFFNELQQHMKNNII
ncbi:hypothetical protein NEMIN01_0585 [Nematocida minor]|uniref:uncharacterized protein n=1 Tax=Nematocida minor TaxID=1912983 RepID=UPI00221F7CE8|nr:uncharacterized protein NEMIN01_0585 [Nematocida minor]KAI5189632.1 hypothetical protein NEMIN01_0585 [Nematocida minor]